jgi:sulfur carrier protein
VKLWINGENRETSGASSIAQLIEQLGLPAAAVLVEHNGDALRREEWPGRSLAEGDRLEIIRIVAGG